MPDRAALVTGGSSGIGLAIAHALGEELRAAGHDVVEVAADLTSEEEIATAVAAHRDAFGSPTCVIPETVFQRPGESL